MANSKIPNLQLSDTLNKLRTSFNQLLDSAGDISTLNTTATDLTSAINEIHDSIGEVGLDTTATTIKGAVNEHEADIGDMTFTGLTATDISAALRELRTELGDHTALTTSSTTDAISAINELRDSIGTEGALDTRFGAKNLILAINQLNDSIGSDTLGTDATTLIAAINELETALRGTTGNYNLSTTATDVVNAINELHDSIGEVGLSTTATSIKAAINELDAELGTISSGAMGTSASTVSTAIAELDSDRDRLVTYTGIPLGLDTTATTLSGAVNELDAELGTISSGAMGTDASTVSGAIAELDSRLDSINNTELTSSKIRITGATVSTIAGNLEVADSAEFANNASVRGNLIVGGNTTMNGTLTVDGQVTFKAGADNNIALGDASTDTITITGEVNSNIIPDTNNSYDLGSSSKQWNHLYVDGTANIDNVAADSATIGTLTVTGDTTFNNTITVQDSAYVTGNLDVGNNLTVATAATLASAAVSDLTSGRIVVAGTSGELQDDSKLTWNTSTGLKTTEALTVEDSAYITGNLNVGGNVDVTGNVTIGGNITVGDAATDTVTFSADVTSNFIPDQDDTYDLGSNSQQWRDLYVSGTANIDNVAADSATLGTVKVSDLTNNQVVVAGTSGELEGDTNLTYDGTTFEVGTAFDVSVADGSVVTTGTVSTGELTATSAKVSDLTNNRVTIVGTDGELEDDNNFTFDGETLTVGQTTINIETVGINTTGLDADSATLGTVKVSDLTNNRVVIAGASGELEDDTNFTFDGTTLNVGNTSINRAAVGINTTGMEADSATLGTVKVTDLTNNRVVLAGTNGELEDDTNFTFDGQTFTVGSTTIDKNTAGINTTGLEADSATITGNLDAQGITTLDETTVDGTLSVTDSANITGDLTVGGSTNITGDLNVTQGFTVGGTFTVTGEQRLASQFIFLNDGITGSPTLNAGITVDRGTSDSAVLIWNETEDYWEIGTSAAAYEILSTNSIDSSTLTQIGGTIAVKENGVSLGTHTSGFYVNDVEATASTGINVTHTQGEGSTATIAGIDATTSVKGVASFSSDNFTVSSGAVSIKDNGITLGTETTGNYIATIAGTANEIDVSGSGSETAAVTIGLPDDVTVSNNLTVSGDLVVAGGQTITGATTTASAYFTTLQGVGTGAANAGLAVFRSNTSNDSAYVQWNETEDYWEAGITGDLKKLAREGDSATFTTVRATDGQISGILYTDQIRSYTGSEQVYVNDTLELQANNINDVNNIYLRTNLIHDGDTNTYLGFTTDNIKLRTGGTDRVEINNNEIIFSENIQVNDSAYITGNLFIGGDTLLEGDLTVRGTTTTVNTETINLADNIIALNSNATGVPSGATDAGIEIERGSYGNVQLLWDESENYWVAATDSANTKSRIATANWLDATAPISFNSTTGNISHDDLLGAGAGQFGDGTTVPQITVDSQGHITSISNVSITSDNYSSWTLAADGGSSQTISSGNTATIAGGTYLTSIASATDTVTINHNTTTRTNTSVDSTPDHGETFPAISSITTNSTGHITAVTTTNVTLPEVGASNAVSATSGTDITLTLANNDDVIEFRTTDKNPASGTQGTYGPRLQFATLDTTAGWGIRTYGSDASMQTRMFFDSNGIQIGGDIVHYVGATPVSEIAEEVDLTLRGSLILDGSAPLVTSTSDVTIDATGDITLDADGNNIYFKNGGGADTWTWTLNNDATGELSAPGNFTLSTTSGDIYVKPTGDNVIMQGTTANEELNFSLGTTTQSITASDNLLLTGAGVEVRATSGNDVIITAGSTSDIVEMRGGVGNANSIEFEFALSAQTIKSDDLLNIETVQGDIYLKPAGNDIYMQGTDGASAQIRFDLETSDQTIAVSDTLILDAAGDITLDADGGQIYLKDGGTQRGYIDVATADTIKIYTGSSTLNTTFSGDDITVQGDVTSLSDARTKENIVDIKDGIGIVESLRGVYYNKIGEEDRKVGVIAQEVEEVLPEVVKTDEEGMKSVDYSKMVGVLIEAIKDLKSEIEELKARG